MSRSIRSESRAFAALALVVAACGGTAAPTGPVVDTSTSPTASVDTSSPASPASDATDAAQPTDPAEPTDGPAPTDPTEPTDAAEPSDPAEPSDGGEPGAGIPSDPALYGTGLVPDGWQVVEDATVACRIAVPPDWTTDVAPGTGTSSVLAEALGAVSSAAIPWEEYKQTVDQFYLTGHETLVDTDDIFMIANPQTPDFDLAYVLVLRFEDTNCHLLVTAQGNATDEQAADALLIGQTLDHTD